ncbi:hypothetical protein H1R20_g11628, partial [Candolleomyces eurysporus]
MFNSFKRRAPSISIFHHPSSPPSLKALKLLQSANTSPYPANKSPSAPPLEYNLEVVESPPTTDQVRTILSYMPSKATSPSMALLSAHPSAGAGETRPQSIEAIVELARKTPAALKWPIVVDWEDGKAVIGDVEGVKSMLETLRKKRDGEEKTGDEVDQPKGWFT